ncbi:conjugal transfer protein [Salmonella enterica]|nr:conjugal transfer protein [Salmonella enterica]
MNMRKTLAAALCGLILIPVSVGAATCRAGSAAQAGSDAGYERARTAADAWSQRENDVSSSLQSCLSRIKKISLNIPQFPSLDSLLSQLENQVCDAAVDKVNDRLPGNIDPWKNYGS